MIWRPFFCFQIAGNILREPSNEKFRSVNLSSSVVERKLIPAVGALEILFLMGFEEVIHFIYVPSPKENEL